MNVIVMSFSCRSVVLMLRQCFNWSLNECYRHHLLKLCKTICDVLLFVVIILHQMR